MTRRRQRCVTALSSGIDSLTRLSRIAIMLTKKLSRHAFQILALGAAVLVGLAECVALLRARWFSGRRQVTGA